MSTTVWQHLPPMGGSGTTARVTMRWAGATEVGRIRSVNEDALVAEPPVFVVADGMGGHEAGDVASAIAIERLCGLLEAPPVRPEQVSELLESVNSEILDAGSFRDDERAMGTTAVGLVLIDGASGPTWLVFNIGDSRIYRFCDGVTAQLSVDHSYVQELIEAGRISEHAARTHPQRNVVTRVLGVDAEVRADLWLRSPIPGERFLLCSDGLSGELAPEALHGVLSQPRSPEDVTVALVDMAMSVGGRDNITVVVVDVEAVDGVAEDEHITAPREVPATEHRVVEDPGDSGVPSQGIVSSHEIVSSDETASPKEIVSSKENVLTGVPPEVSGDVPDGSHTPDTGVDAVPALTMIAGVPPELPSIDDVGGGPTFEPAGSKDTEAASTPTLDAVETEDEPAGARDVEDDQEVGSDG